VQQQGAEARVCTGCTGCTAFRHHGIDVQFQSRSLRPDGDRPIVRSHAPCSVQRACTGCTACRHHGVSLSSTP
jgi:hypothetical protein